MALLEEAAGPYDSGLPRTATVAMSFYIRWLFEPAFFFEFSRLSSGLYGYIAENKSFPGRDAPNPDQECGRPITICWFQILDHTREGLRVAPVATVEHGNLSLMEATIAGICMQAGDHTTAASDATPMDHEYNFETNVLQHMVIRYTGRRIGDINGPWTFVLTDAQELEDAWVTNRHANDLGKMCLSRQLQLRDQLTDEKRNKLWSFPKDVCWLLTWLVRLQGKVLRF